MARVQLGDKFVDVEEASLPDRALRAAWVATGNVVTIDPGMLLVALMRHGAEQRWKAETGGTTIDLGGGPIPIPTDDRAKLLLLGAASGMADADTAPFVTAAGTVVLTGAQFKAIFAAILAHVSACFDAQAKLNAEIKSGKITTIAEVEAWVFPGG